MLPDRPTIPRPGAIPIVKRQPALRPPVVQAKTNGRFPLQTSPARPSLFHSPARPGVLQPKAVTPVRPQPHRALTSNTIQAYHGDDWEGEGWDRQFRSDAQASISAEWRRAKGYQKGAKGDRKTVAPANTFASYGMLVWQSDAGECGWLRFGARLSGNPSIGKDRLYAEHEVRESVYNKDCSELYIIKQARRHLPNIPYRDRDTAPPRPTLYIYSDHSPCPQCQRDFDQLQQQFGDLEVVIMYEQRYMAHWDDDVWDMPGLLKKVVYVCAPEDQDDISGRKRLAAKEEAEGWKVA